MLVALPANAQPSLRSAAVASGAVDATSRSLRMRATVGQAATGHIASQSRAVAQGFWPAASVGMPTVVVALTPETSPLVVRPGSKFRLEAGFTVPASGPASFQYWAQATYPDGAQVDVLGPITLMLSPPTQETLSLLQIVATDAPPGGHVYTMFAGTHPSDVLSQAAFRYTVRWPTDGLPTSVPLAAGLDRHETGPPTVDSYHTARELAALEEAPGPWLVFDAAGQLLLPGHVMDLRADSAVASTHPDTMAPESMLAPEESHVMATDLPTVATLGVPYPNPARTSTTIRFGLPADAPARLTVYDALGRRVAVLAEGTHAAGWHMAAFTTAGLAGGLYIVRLDADDRQVTQRLTVAR